MAPTRQTIQDAIDEFIEKQEQAISQQDKVRDAFDSIALRTLTASDTALRTAMEAAETVIQQKLDVLLAKIQEAAEGILAPFYFIDRAADWQDVGAEVRAARNEVLDGTGLEGHWDGVAADKYSAAKGKQDRALAAADKMCDDMHTNLLALSETGQTFFFKCTNLIVGWLAPFGAALVDISTGVLAPWGAADAIKQVVLAVPLFTELFTATAVAVTKQIVVANEIANSIDSPVGFKGNRWPKATTAQYADASVKDGDESDWAVPA
jgi:uncharacterized protein YqgV (UPF0045/DUF77 family)